MTSSANANLFARLFDGLQDPLKTAIETDGREVSYGELEEFTARTANYLVAQGVKPGDRIAVQVEKSLAAVVLYLATIRAGAAFQGRRFGPWRRLPGQSGCFSRRPLHAQRPGAGARRRR